MISELKDINARMKKLIVAISLVAATLVMSINVAFVHSSLLGAVASCAYVVLAGSYLGRVLLGDEDEAFSRCVFGIFLLISVFLIVGTLIVLFYNLNVLGLMVIFSVPLILLFLSVKLFRSNFGKSKVAIKKADALAYFSPVYVIFFILIGYCTFLLVDARSGWVLGTVWDIVSPSFFPAYFLAAFTLVGIILLSKTKALSKMLLSIVFALITFTIPAVVLFPGNAGDASSHLAGARLIFDYGSLKMIFRGVQLSPFHYYLLLKERGLMLLSALLAKMFMIDVYWVHTFIPPVLWGVFVPLTAYKTVRMVGGGGKVSALAAFLPTFYSTFTIWGSISTANSVGYIFFFVSLYFSIRYLKSKRAITLLSAVISSISTGLAHPSTGIMSFTFLFLAMALKKYEAVKVESPRRAHLFILPAFSACVFVIVAMFGLQNFLYLYLAPSAIKQAYMTEVIALDIGKLLKTDSWELVFGEFMGYPFKEAVLLGSFIVLGALGLVYALKQKNKYQRVLTSFVFLSFLISLVDFRIMQYAMTNVPFGPARILLNGYLMVVPFAALPIVSVVEFLGGGVLRRIRPMMVFKGLAIELSARHALSAVLVGLSLSGFALSSTYRSYTVLFGGLQPTQLAYDAAKFIDEHADGRYVVITVPHMSTIGEGIAGWWNPEKYYVYGPGQPPSVAEMEKYMGTYEATVGYYVALSYGGMRDFEKAIAESSLRFGLLKVLSNEHGEIYIFQYRVPFLPTSPDVMAFYWDTPPTYIIQNDLMRVVFNPEHKVIDVRDFWGDLYESIDLNEALVDKKSLGNLTSIEYYDPSNYTWVVWEPHKEIPPIPALAEEFQFRFQFENESLNGVVQRGKPFVQLRWESGHTSTFSLRLGDFKRLYIPGLVGGVNSYGVNGREFGLLYTTSRTSGVVLHPAYNPEVTTSSLTLGQIERDCNLTITEGALWYDLYVKNIDKVDKWAYVEVWLPDKTYLGIRPPIGYSSDGGKTWIYREPIKTLSGVNVNWVFTLPARATEKPRAWDYQTAGAGGRFLLPNNFTDSGGGQNRLLFGIYLPAEDKALVRLGVSIYGCHPLEVTYVFTDSDNISYGLRNMNGGLIKLYNYGSSEYVGGLALTERPRPLSLEIVQDETDNVRYMLVTIPANATFSLLSAKEVNTMVDDNNDGIPDLIEG